MSVYVWYNKNRRRWEVIHINILGGRASKIFHSEDEAQSYAKTLEAEKR